MTSYLNAQNMSNDINSSIVDTTHKLYLTCLQNKDSICDKKLRYTSKYKTGCWLLTLSGTE